MKGKPKKSCLKIGCSFLLLLLFVFVVYSFINPWWMLMNGAEKWMLGPATMTDERTPTWSADSQYVAFLCAYSYITDVMDPNIWDNPYWHHEESDVCVYDFKNKTLERITFTRHKSNVAWSIDGTFLSWLTDDHIPTIYDFSTHQVLQEEYYIDYTKNKSLCDKFMWSDNEHPCWVFKEREQEEFFNDFVGRKTMNFEWSFDGEYLAFTKEEYVDEGGNDFDSLKVKDPEETILLESKPHMFGFEYDWSPVDSVLAWRPAMYRGQSPDENTIALTHFPSGETVFIPIDPGYYWSGDWLPGGYLLEFSRDENQRIMIVSLKCTVSPFSCHVTQRRIHQLEHPYDNWDDTISLSPDGKYLTYTSRDKSYTSRIWIVDLETGKETLMLENR